MVTLLRLHFVQLFITAKDIASGKLLGLRDMTIWRIQGRSLRTSYTCIALSTNWSRISLSSLTSDVLRVRFPASLRLVTYSLTMYDGQTPINELPWRSSSPPRVSSLVCVLELRSFFFHLQLQIMTLDLPNLLVYFSSPFVLQRFWQLTYQAQSNDHMSYDNI